MRTSPLIFLILCLLAIPAYGEGVLIERIIHKESRGVSSAVSPRGAVGLMQLLPSTGKAMAKKLGLTFHKDMLKDPLMNIKLGTAYLNEQLQTYDNNLVLALAAYNAGPGTVNRWLKRYGDPRTGEISTKDFVDKIPYKETRNYITHIIGDINGQA